MRYFTFAITILLCLVSCKTREITIEKEVPVEVEVIRDVFHNSVDTIRDSIYHDVYVNQYIKGDTVYHDRVEYLVKDRWRIRDSIRVECCTIPKVVVQKTVEKQKVEVPVEVPGKMTKWQSFRASIGSFSLVLLAIALAYILYKVYRKLRP